MLFEIGIGFGERSLRHAKGFVARDCVVFVVFRYFERRWSRTPQPLSGYSMWRARFRPPA